MPAVSKKQQKYMGMCANKKPKPKRCPSKKVASKMAKKPKGGYSRKT